MDPRARIEALLQAETNGYTPASVFQRALASQLRRIDRVQQLVLLRTGLGHAQSLCALLDGAGLPDVVGTLAGEDTILIITPDTRRARGLVKRLEEMLEHMKSPVVLAYAGGIHASAAIPWLADTLGVEVVTVTLDVGQGHELAELRARALACGAVRAHAVDARDGFARDVLVPSLFTSEPADAPRPSISRLPWPLIARTLTEIARIEGAGAVAHGSTDPAFDACIHAVDSSLSMIAPAREWTMNDANLIEHARARRLPLPGPATPGCRIDQNMWGRWIAWEGDDEPTSVRAPHARGRVHEPALVDIHFERGMPTAVKGVRCRRPS